MAASPSSSSSLELTISVLGFSSSPSRPSSGDQGVRDLDINQKPADEEWRIGATMEDEEESSHGNGGSAVACPPRKKLRLTKEQSHLLEESFRLNHTLNPKQKQELAVQLKLRPRQVEVWFQNRRARSKLKQTEIECEYLKRWFGSLTEQNRRLQREVEELRALKVSPPTVISPHTSQPLLASTLTMCPRCERVTSTATATATTSARLDKGSPSPTATSHGGSPGSQSRRPSSSAAC